MAHVSFAAVDGEIEALGSVATAGLAADALTPAAARARPARAPCLNCGATLAGAFCHACGQAAHVHRSIGHVVEEIAHGVLHVDSKGWRTLPLLAFDPGRLTREYVAGRRARYIPPLALFLFAFFLMFLVFGFSGGPGGDQRVLNINDETLAIAPGEKPIHAAMRRLSREVEVEVGGQGIDPALTAKARRALANPELTLYKIEQKAYKLSFLLIPLSLPMLWLLFAGRRGAHLYDHTVFVLYSLSFMSLLIIVTTLMTRTGDLGGNLASAALMVIPPIHMFRQLRGAYGLSRRGALWRTAALLLLSAIVLVVYFGLMLVLGLLG